MKHTPINFQKKFAGFFDICSPKIVAQMNDYHFKLVKFKGDFVWHRHDDGGGPQKLDNVLSSDSA